MARKQHDEDGTTSIAVTVTGAPNFLIDASRSARETEHLTGLLEILEQRAKEITAHVKCGLVCQHADDKVAAIKRAKELLDDAARVARQLRDLADGGEAA